MQVDPKDFYEKFGSLIQYGVNYMEGFSAFADVFIEKYSQYLPDLEAEGYSLNFSAWQKDNAAEIIALYDGLKAANLIPTTPAE